MTLRVTSAPAGTAVVVGTPVAKRVSSMRHGLSALNVPAVVLDPGGVEAWQDAVDVAEPPHLWLR